MLEAGALNAYTSHVNLKARQDVEIMHTPVLAEREQSGDYQINHQAVK
jgi:hypothetical protein